MSEAREAQAWLSIVLNEGLLDVQKSMNDSVVQIEAQVTALSPEPDAK